MNKNEDIIEKFDFNVMSNFYYISCINFKLEKNIFRKLKNLQKKLVMISITFQIINVMAYYSKDNLGYAQRKTNDEITTNFIEIYKFKF